MTDEEHEAALQEITGLMKRDPAPGTPDGDKLLALVKEVEAYEEERFPLPAPEGAKCPHGLTEPCDIHDAEPAEPAKCVHPFHPVGHPPEASCYTGKPAEPAKCCCGAPFTSPPGEEDWSTHRPGCPYLSGVDHDGNTAPGKPPPPEAAPDEEMVHPVHFNAALGTIADLRAQLSTAQADLKQSESDCRALFENLHAATAQLADAQAEADGYKKGLFTNHEERKQILAALKAATERAEKAEERVRWLQDERNERMDRDGGGE